MNEQQIKERAVYLIGLHLGDSTAEMYRNFYTNKSGEQVVTSASALLAEVLGDQKAKMETKDLVLTS